VLYEYLNQVSELFSMLNLAIGKGFDGPLSEQSDALRQHELNSLSKLTI